MKKNTFALGIVLYDPDEDIIKKVNTYILSGLFNKVLVYDNSNIQSYTIENCVYRRSGKNDGLSIPYNWFMRLAKENDIDYLCLLDQDSNYPIVEIEKMIEFLNSSSINMNKIGIIAPRTYSSSSNRIQRSESITKVKYTINSGSFVNINIIDVNNINYDENIFLDGVDLDFCLTLHKAGIDVVVYENSVFEQNLGYPSPKNNTYYCHSPFRYYLIAHNKKIIYTKYYGKFRGQIIAFSRNIGLLIKILKYEVDRKKKILECVKGIFY